MESKDNIVVLNNRQIDLISGEIINLSAPEAEPHRLGPKLRVVLSILLNNKNRVLTREQILDKLNAPETITDRQVDRYISDIRKAVGDYDALYIKTVTSVGYKFVDKGLLSEDKIKSEEKYSPFDGLKECISILPEARQVEMFFHTGIKLLTDEESKTYFLSLLSAGYHFKVIVNSKESLSQPVDAKDADYLDLWNLFSSAHNQIVEVRVSNKTFYHRIYILRESENRGAANLRQYNYLENYDITNAKTYTVQYPSSEYLDIRNEFASLWKQAIPINGYLSQIRIKSESFSERLVEAFIERENHNITKYIDALTDLASEGYAKAANLLGVHYIMGEFVEKDYRKGLPLIVQAAENNCLPAIVNLGLFSWLGCVGIEQDYKKAVSYFQSAANRDEPDGDACYYLYIAFRDGCGTAKDAAKATYYRKVAQKLGVTSQNTYGLI